MVQPNVKAGSSSSRQLSMLNPLLEVVSGLHIEMTPEDESVLAFVPTNNLIAEWMELHKRSLVVGRTLGEELERDTRVVTKQKNELAESTTLL